MIIQPSFLIVKENHITIYPLKHKRQGHHECHPINIQSTADVSVGGGNLQHIQHATKVEDIDIKSLRDPYKVERLEPIPWSVFLGLKKDREQIIIYDFSVMCYQVHSYGLGSSSLIKSHLRNPEGSMTFSMCRSLSRKITKSIKHRSFVATTNESLTYVDIPTLHDY